MYHELKPITKTRDREIIVTIFKCSRILPRFLFLFTGRLNIIERSFESTKCVSIGDAFKQVGP